MPQNTTSISMTDDEQYESILVSTGNIEKLGSKLSESVMLRLIADNPGYYIQHFQHASEAVKMFAVEQEPACINLIDNPSAALVLKAYARDCTLIRDQENPTVEQQLTVLRADWYALHYIKNPCRQAALIGLATYGRYLERLFDLQQATAAPIAATSKPVCKDIELQVAALSNITGIELYRDRPDLFDKEGINREMPGLTACVDTLLSLGYGSEEYLEIRTALACHKESIATGGLVIDLPVNTLS